MKNKEYVFIGVNAIIISLLSFVAKSMNYDWTDKMFTVELGFTGLVMCFLFGGEFILTSVFAFHLHYKINFNILLLSFVIDYCVMNLFKFNLDFIYIFICWSQQILGIILARFLRTLLFRIKKLRKRKRI